MLLPVAPDASARALRAALGVGAVVITDSLGRAWRHGQVEVAIGCAGLAPLVDWRLWRIARARARGDLIAVADEAAAAADLVRGKVSGEPAVRIRGLEPLLPRKRAWCRRAHPGAGGTTRSEGDGLRRAS